MTHLFSPPCFPAYSGKIRRIWSDGQKAIDSFFGERLLSSFQVFGMFMKGVYAVRASLVFG